MLIIRILTAYQVSEQIRLVNIDVDISFASPMAKGEDHEIMYTVGCNAS